MGLSRFLLVAQCFRHGGLFRPYLKGTAFWFIRLGDVIDVMQETVNSINTGNRSLYNVQNALAQIEVASSSLQKQLDYLMQLRKALFYKYIKHY